MKTKILTLFVFFFLCISFCSWGQEKREVDSLLKAFETLPERIEKVETSERLFRAFIQKEQKKAFYYAEQQLEIAKKIDYTTGEGIAYKSMAYYYRLAPNADSARVYFKKSIKTLEKIGDAENLWDAVYQRSIFENLEGNYTIAYELAHYSSEIAMDLKDGEKLTESVKYKAVTHLDKGNFKAATELAILAAKIADTLNPPNPLKKAGTMVCLARIDIVQGNYEAALKPLQDALVIFIEEKDERWQATTLMEMGNLNWYIEEYDTAFINYKQSLKISKKIGNKEFVAMNLSNIGLLNQSLGNYNLALEAYFEALELEQQGGAISNINNNIIGLNNIATVYASKKEYQNAITYFSKAIKKSDSIKSVDIIRDGYYGRSRAYENIGDFKNALADQRSYQLATDSVFNTTKSRQIEELKTKYESEKKEQQLALQDKEITVLEQEAKISNQQKILLGGGLALSILTLGFGYYGFRQRTKKNKLEKEKVEADLEFKKKELTTHALHLAKKNEVLENVKIKAKDLKLQGDAKGYQELIKTINFDQQDDKNWESFTQYFEQVHTDFAANVQKRYPDVTKNELRFMALLKMNMSSKEIATILNISPDGIKKARQRLRKKMSLTPDISLENTVLAI